MTPVERNKEWKKITDEFEKDPAFRRWNQRLLAKAVRKQKRKERSGK